MPTCPNASVSTSPDVVASSSGGSGFSSMPINMVVSSRHSRRRRTSGGWLDSDSKKQKTDDSSSSETQDDDVLSKLRPSSIGSQSSLSSSSKVEDETRNDDGRSRQKPSQPLPSLSSGSAVLLRQLREHQRRSNVNASASSGSSDIRVSTSTTDMPNTLLLQSEVDAVGASPNSLTSLRRWEEERNSLIRDGYRNEEEDDEEESENLATPGDMRIMFHGREIFAEDLIGLRVAKTFAGYGRFLGQVVKFDKKVALYTVVYADGDAEDLTVDNTLQILIQDEIERADPSQLSPSISLLLDKSEARPPAPASPNTGDLMIPPAPLQHQTSTLQRLTRIQVSEREAQFVASLFENYALPALVRQGWRVQTGSSGRGEIRLVSPIGEIFQSTLDVVGYIASDMNLLTSCFPANVHSAILSLLPREATANSTAFAGTDRNQGRKHVTLDSPNAEHFNGKRMRQVYNDAYEGLVAPVRTGAVQGGDVMHYGHKDLDRQAESANRNSAYCGQGIDGRIRMSGDRFAGGTTTSEACIQAPPEMRGYRHTSSRDPPLENPFISRWSAGEAVPDCAESAGYSRRYVDMPRWRERGEAFALDHHLEAHSRTRIHTKSRYVHRSNTRTLVDVEGNASATASGTSEDFYRDSTGSPSSSQASQMANGQYSAPRARASDYDRTSNVPRISRETASFMSPTDTLGASVGFSMVDVDRISKSRSGSAHTEQPCGHSPQSPLLPTTLPHQ